MTFQSQSQWLSRAMLEENFLLPEAFYSWLDSSNLCETLVKMAGSFSLNLLEQRFAAVHEDEQDFFKPFSIESRQALIRKVILNGGQKPLIFARVVIPEPVFKAHQTILENLGNAPIGKSFLYPDKRIKRQDFVFKIIGKTDRLYAEFLSVVEPGDCWARRSIFILPEGPLLMTEVFLALTAQASG